MGRYVLFWVPQFKKDVEKQERSIQRADEMLSGLQHLTCENMLKKLGLVSLSKKKIRGDLIRIYNYLKGSGKDH